MAWTPAEAHAFLKAIPAFEAAGLVVRVPDCWRTRRPPRPEVLTIVAEGTRVLAEAHIYLASGERMHVVDGFEIDGEHIRSLTYFIADYPSASDA